jgi:hypothetical protein
MKPLELLENIKQREENCWKMAQTLLDNRDAHGVMDMGAELQALQRARREIEKLSSDK